MLTTQQLESELGYTAVYSPYCDREVAAGFTSDLLSDIMGSCPENSVLVTIQAHTNTVAVATLVETAAIIICSNRPIPDEMAAAARDEDIALFVTEKNQFQVSCEVGSRL